MKKFLPFLSLLNYKNLTGFKNLLGLLLFLSSTSISNAQSLLYELPENASKLYHAGNYVKALELYREIYKKDMADTKNTYYFGVCLIETFDFDNGIKTLEKISNK